MPKQAPSRRGVRAANPELFKSPPTIEWENRGLLDKKPDPSHPKRFIYQLALPARIPKKLEKRIPSISFGEKAPVPRWQLIPDTTDPSKGKDLEKDLIRTTKGKSIIDGVAPGSHPRSFDSSIGLGALQWSFDPGLPANHPNMLHGKELYEMAYHCLTEALRNPISRTQMKREIVNGPLWPNVCNVEDPLPPPPPRPETNFFSRFTENYEKPDARSDDPSYERPSSTARSLGWTPKDGTKPTYADRLVYHAKGTTGLLHQANPHKVLRGDTSDNSESEATEESKIAKIVPKSSSHPKKKSTKNRKGKKSQDQTIVESGKPGKTSKKRKPADTASTTRKKSRTTSSKKVTFDLNDDDENDGFEVISVMTRVSHMEGSSKDPQPVKIPVDELDTGDLDTEMPDAPKISKRFPTLAPGDVNMTIHNNSDYLQTFKEACKSPEDRKKYFPMPKVVRRIKPWAGNNIPTQVQRQVVSYLPNYPSSYRPFTTKRLAMMEERDDNDGKAPPGTSRKSTSKKTTADKPAEGDSGRSLSSRSLSSRSLSRRRRTFGPTGPGPKLRDNFTGRSYQASSYW